MAWAQKFLWYVVFIMNTGFDNIPPWISRSHSFACCDLTKSTKIVAYAVIPNLEVHHDSICELGHTPASFPNCQFGWISLSTFPQNACISSYYLLISRRCEPGVAVFWLYHYMLSDSLPFTVASISSSHATGSQCRER